MTRGMHVGPRGTTHQSPLPGLKWMTPCLAVLCVLLIPVAVAGDDGDWVSVVSSNTIFDDPTTDGIHDVPDPVTYSIIDDGDPFACSSVLGYVLPWCRSIPLDQICTPADEAYACAIYMGQQCPSPCDDEGLDISGCCYIVQDDRRMVRDVTSR